MAPLDFCSITLVIQYFYRLNARLIAVLRAYTLHQSLLAIEVEMHIAIQSLAVPESTRLQLGRPRYYFPFPKSLPLNPILTGPAIAR
jgi:hypothetical protein